VPYLFLKPTEGAIIGNGDAVVLPYGRDRIDWEVELGIVIGRAGEVRAGHEGAEHIFGYMVTVDISDRGGRPPDSRPGRTGSSARATTRSRRWGRGSCRRSSTATR
jgi:2-keto-4-pentenoate hydratase/2-oxohepta-3-ene-1,7-dioic acid hydratase in catechol pathway